MKNLQDNRNPFECGDLSLDSSLFRERMREGFIFNGWLSLSWDGGEGIFYPQAFEGKDIYLNYAILKNAQVQMRFLKIKKDKITIQCIKIYRQG